ncbi:hypothetical protein YC2023_052819 [Brassica napus]
MFDLYWIRNLTLLNANDSLHWILIIICHPGEVANCTGLDFDDSTKVPCILHMDSVKGSHAGLENLVQRYVNCLTAIFQFHLLSLEGGECIPVCFTITRSI